MPSIRIAAVVATHNRPYQLANVCLKSIGLQTRHPDFLVVVDDSDPRFRHQNHTIVTDFASRWTKTVYLENYRTPGASGAWNSALAWLCLEVPDAFVAILDDDDSWAPTYLERCAEAIEDSRYDFITAGIIRHDDEHPDGRKQDVPKVLTSQSFLDSNPHVQGSNLFVRLKTLLMAGGFDEALPSTTDRDICIRILDLGDARHRAVDEHLVNHHAAGGQGRLSTFGSEAKKRGAIGFYSKYKGRMTPEQQSNYKERAMRLFGCDVEAVGTAPWKAGDLKPRANVIKTPLFLTIGMISSPQTSHLEDLLSDIHVLKAQDGAFDCKIVVLNNSGPGMATKVANIIERWSERGLDIILIDYDVQERDARKGLFRPLEFKDIQRKSIAVSRTMLQHYVYYESQLHPGSLSWILDDDSRLDNLVVGDDGRTVRQSIDSLSMIRRLREREDVAIALCTVTGDPPLPFSSCVRTQLVDLYHNLEWMAMLEPASILPNRAAENMDVRSSHHDFYYDFSRTEMDHLETPFWYVPEKGSTVLATYVQMVKALQGIMCGRQVFRPLIMDPAIDPLERIVPSIHRGGNTIVFHNSALKDYPNIVPVINEKHTRRSDMVWCLLNRFISGRKIVEVAIPVRQERDASGHGRMDFDKLVEDIHGYALYSSMHDVFLRRAEERMKAGRQSFGIDLLELGEDDISFVLSRYRKYINERARAFEFGFHRVMGLLHLLGRYVDERNTTSYWWLRSPETKASVLAFRTFLERMEAEFNTKALRMFKDLVQTIDEKVIVDFFRGLEGDLDAFRNAREIISDAFTAKAQSELEKALSLQNVRYLGHGEEGVVFTDGASVYKCIYPWKRHISAEQKALLKGLSGRRSDSRTLYPFRMVDLGDSICFIYPFEESVEYRGGHLDEIIRFLNECRSLDIVFDNMNPGNFRVTKDGLKLIDYGGDIRPFSKVRFESMCKRAYLMYRFHYRTDLKHLLRLSLTDETMPELFRYNIFKEAVNARMIHEILYPRLVELVKRHSPESILDYGCGKGPLTERLHKEGFDVVGFDIDAELIRLCKGHGSGVEYQDSLAEVSGKDGRRRFDLVVSSLVLCVVDDDECRSILRNMRCLVREDGTALVAICNPFYTLTGDSELQTRRRRTGARYDETFEYRTHMKATGNDRSEWHRPLDKYVRLFLEAGFSVASMEESQGCDTEQLVPSSDFLFLTLKPIPRREERVSLLIKACAMEWRWVEHGIRHIVHQLEGPRTFLEKVVVTDDYAHSFLRQYEEANPHKLRSILERLKAEGVIDRVVYAPYSEDAIREKNRRWFGQDVTATHASNGQNVYPTIFGLDECRGDLVLQVDSDVLVARKDRVHDYLGDMLQALADDPQAVSVSFNIARRESGPYTSEGSEGPWRIEVRNCLLHKERLDRLLPLENPLEDKRFQFPWHRALDGALRSTDGHSYRGGDSRTFYIHVPNDRKMDLGELFSTMDRVEVQYIPDAQYGSVDLVGGWDSWAGPKRLEPIVFIICSRNVHPGRFKDCWSSVIGQTVKDWGAVIVDGASENGLGDYIEMLIAPHRDRVTLVRDKEKRGLLYSTWSAITQFCGNKESIIITLDADDALIGPHVLERVLREYNTGADVTVGSMLRTDKDAKYIPVFDHPRRNRGGNVWQHLRTFRKYLFDRIRVDDLLIDGQWVDVATDWQFMLPIVEMARNPRYIKDKLYYYEPSAEAPDRRKVQEDIIGKICAKDEYKRFV